MAQIGELNTVHGKLEAKFKWKIPYSELQEDYICHSVSFAGASWHMIICCNGLSEYNSSGYVGTYLMFQSHDLPLNMQVCFAIETVDCEEYYKRCSEQIPFVKEYEFYGIHKLISRAELSENAPKLLPSSFLTIFCIVKHSEPSKVLEQIHGNANVCCIAYKDYGFLFYRCKTCQLTRDMCLCPDCFERGNHDGHDVIKFSSSRNAYCDCGDKNFLKESGFCDRHGPQNKTKKLETNYDLSEDEVPHLFLKLIQNLRDNSESGKSCTSSTSPAVLHPDRLLHDFKELFLSKEDCDVVINVKGQEFLAHKNILKARSPVLASTFRNDMKEKKTRTVEIKDCDPASFADFLCFLYCGNVETISEENVFSLFTTADKYDVQDLRQVCLEYIKEKLSVETFCEAITLALQHSETELVKLATNFFIKNAPKIVVTVKWQLFAAENPTQSNELIVKLLVPEARSNN